MHYSKAVAVIFLAFAGFALSAPAPVANALPEPPKPGAKLKFNKSKVGKAFSAGDLKKHNSDKPPTAKAEED
ncbi:hypothetical protein ABW20_dc0109685 [Dactylellina cionopaga]|nr:hypothetical protein ABW20_dc0109685 [Dactylellina cionopaga]